MFFDNPFIVFLINLIKDLIWINNEWLDWELVSKKIAEFNPGFWNDGYFEGLGV